MKGLETESGVKGRANLNHAVTVNAENSAANTVRFNSEETARSMHHWGVEEPSHRKDCPAQNRISASNAYGVMAQIEATHRSIIQTQIRRLEALSDNIINASPCNCAELGKVIAGFEKFQSVLMPSMIREQCLLMPTVLEKIDAETSGIEYCESYRGELADLIRTTEADHHQLQSLCNQLRTDLNALISKGVCPNIVNSFASQFVNFADFLKLQFDLEDTFLRSCCARDCNCQ